MADTQIRLTSRADLSAIQQMDSAFKALDRTQQQAIKTQLQLAQATARLDAAQGNASGGAARLRQTLSGLSAAPARAIVQTETQIAKLSDTTTYAQRVGQAFGQQLASIAGPAAIATGALGAVNKAIEAGSAALQLRETENSLRLVAGSAQVYNEIIETARKQQLLFGGSLQENIEGLQGLAIVSRTSGASLKTLIDLQQRLTVLDPAQGAQGARIALNEALSGNVASLSRRFEIPKDQLKKLGDTSLSTEERLRALSDFLDKAGISSEAVAGKVDKTAEAYRRLGAVADNVKTSLGGALADQFASFARLGGVFTGTRSAFEDAAVGAASFANSMVGLGPVSKATEDQIRSTTKFLQDFAYGAQTAGVALGGAFDTERTTVGLAQLEQQARRVGGAFDEERQAAAQLQVATGQATSDIQRSAEASLIDAANKDRQAAATDLLKRQTTDAVNAFLALNPQIDAAGINALIAAGKLDPLIGQLAATRIEALKTGAALAGLAGQQASEQTAANAALQARANRGGRIDQARVIAEQFKTEKELRQAQSDRINRTGTATQKLSQAQLDYAAAVKKYGKDSSEAYKAQTAVIERQQDVQAEAERKRKAATKGASTISTDLGLAQAGLEGSERLQARLDEVNKKLATAKLTENERNRLTAEKLDLEQKISDELEKQNRSAIDARLADVEDRRKKLDEANQLAAAQRVLASSSTSQDQKARAQLITEQIPLEQQKRQLEIARLSREAGNIVPIVPVTAAGGAPIVGGPAPAGTGGGAAGAGVVAILQLDGKEVGKIIFPTVVAGLRSGRAQVSNAGG